MIELSDKARELKNAYQREWKTRNPDKVRRYGIDFWERKADPIGARVRQLSKQGFTQRQIADKLNISLGAVNGILNAE